MLVMIAVVVTSPPNVRALGILEQSAILSVLARHPDTPFAGVIVNRQTYSFPRPSPCDHKNECRHNRTGWYEHTEQANTASLVDLSHAEHYRFNNPEIEGPT
jgi:hypothetical protein